MASLIRWLFFPQSLNMLTHMLHFHSLDRHEVSYWEILCHFFPWKRHCRQPRFATLQGWRKGHNKKCLYFTLVIYYR